MKHFLISIFIFIFAWIPVFLLGLPTTFILLMTKWNGHSTWFGNYLYGRKGNWHMPANPTLWDEWNFLALRNPISNFGKFTLSREGTDHRAWLEEKKFWRFGILYGWKYPDSRLPGAVRPFVFRPRWYKSK